MERILIVTRNTLAEKGLQEQLQIMNYEVLCHQGTSLDPLLQADGAAFLDFFDCLIVSDTLSEKEYMEIESTLSHRRIRLAVLRRSEAFDRVNRSTSNLLPKAPSFELLRELLAERIGYPQSGDPKSAAALLSEQLARIRWTAKEREVFDYLHEHAGVCMDRETICLALWGVYNNSSKVHLSNLVRQIKGKLGVSGIGAEKLVTLWGQGYRLDQSLKAIDRSLKRTED